jgi:hypothetical protein
MKWNLMNSNILPHQGFGWLLVSGILFMGCKSGINKDKIINANVTGEAINRLLPGMKYEEVESILGKPCMFHPDVALEGGQARAIPNRKPITSYIWCYDCNYMQTISVNFKDSVLIERRFNSVSDISELNDTPCLIQK